MKQDLKLIKSKSLADGAKYFSLFDGHIPTGLNGDKNVYLYRLDNVSCICHIIKKNPEAVYYICDEDHVIEAVKINMDEAKIRNVGDVYEEQEAYKDMKFDCIIMNPPWGDKKTTGIGQKILEEAMQHTDNIVCLYGENEFFKIKNKNRINQFKHCNHVEIKETNKIFNINSRMRACLATFKPNQTFTTFNLEIESDPEYNGIYSWTKDIDSFYSMLYPKAFVDLYKTTDQEWLHLQAVSIKDGMVNLSNPQFEYYENKLKKKNHHSSDVVNSPYKIILNRTSYEHAQDPYYDHIENAGGCTWTCKSDRIKNNMLYWLHDSPLTYIWRKYHLWGTVANCSLYKCLPAVDFDMPEIDFKIWADGLCNGFGKTHTIEEIMKLRFKEET